MPSFSSEQSAAVEEVVVQTTPTEEPVMDEVDEKERFIAKILETEVDGPFNAKPLQDLCARTEWQEGLVMSCKATRGGGMANIRNVFVDCVRFVIEAGGKYLPMPCVGEES